MQREKYEFQSLSTSVSNSPIKTERSVASLRGSPATVKKEEAEREVRKIGGAQKFLENQVVESNQDLDVAAKVKVVTRVQLAEVKIETDCVCHDNQGRLT